MEIEVVSKPHRLKFRVSQLPRRRHATQHQSVSMTCSIARRRFGCSATTKVWTMERGDEIAPSLVAAMEDSAASVVVLSPRYADSHWCLNELAKLCELRASLKRPMIPIFYEVDPSHVRKQSDHFVKDFEKHSKRFDEEKIQRWRAATHLVGNLSGFVWRQDLVDDDMIGLVVKRVLAEVSNTPEKVGEYTGGLESRVKNLMNRTYFPNFDIKISASTHTAQQQTLEGISDKSDRNGMRVVIELKRGGDPALVINNLYRHTALQSSFSCNMVGICNGEPKLMGLKELLQAFIDFRCSVVERRARFKLSHAQQRKPILR